MRLIDADKATELLSNMLDTVAPKKLIWLSWESVLRRLTTEDAEPIRHGKLMRTEAYPHKLYCGECYNTLIPNDEAVEQNWMLKPRYCMYCGAKLDEVEE